MVCHKSLPSKFCTYIYISHSKGVWNSVFIVLCQNLDGRDLWHKYKKIPISSWLLNQIGWGFRWDAESQFLNPKAYLDWFTNLKVIDTESPIVFFFFDNRYTVRVRKQKANPISVN